MIPAKFYSYVGKWSKNHKNLLIFGENTKLEWKGNLWSWLNLWCTLKIQDLFVKLSKTSKHHTV